MQRWIVCAWFGAMAAVGNVCAQGISTMAVQPRRPFLAGTTNGVWVYVVNDTAHEARYSLPEELAGELSLAGGATQAVTLEATGPNVKTPLLVEAETFGKREYLLALPAGMFGRATLDFNDTGFNSVSFDIEGRTNAAAVAAVEKSARSAERESFATEPLSKFFKYFSPYEPIYFIAGSEHPTARFQVSLKYHVFDPGGWMGDNVPGASDLYFGYTQTSLWDVFAPSSPFFDTSYKPGAFLYRRDVFTNGWLALDLQGGYEHESNGRDGADSRSVNMIYAQPTLRLGREDGLSVTLTARAWSYVFDLSNNPDIRHYRGYADMVGALTWKQGLQVSTLFRIGDTGEHSTLQFDVTYPLWRIRWLGGLTPYLHGQYFSGYGESLLRYNQKDEVWRLGLSLYR